MPPLAADGHRRQPVWRDGLALLLDHAGARGIAGAGAGCHAEPACARRGFGRRACRWVPARRGGLGRCGRRALCGGGFAGLLHPDRLHVAGGVVAAAAAAWAVPVLRLDAGGGGGDGVGTDAGRAVSALFALLHRLEPCAGRVHRLRRVQERGDAGGRRRQRRGEGGDVRRLPRIRQDVLSGEGHGGRAVCRRPGLIGAGPDGFGGRMVAAGA